MLMVELLCPKEQNTMPCAFNFTNFKDLRLEHSQLSA